MIGASESDYQQLISLLDRLKVISKERAVDKRDDLPNIEERTINQIKTIIFYLAKNPNEGIFRISSKQGDLQKALQALESDDSLPPTLLSSWDSHLAANILN